MEEERKLYPLKFIPQTEDQPWGAGQYLLADLGIIDSMIDNGFLGGCAISEVMDMYMDRIVGEDAFAKTGRQFPLMARILEVNGNMPLTVNPDDETAEQRFDALGKAKMWYVLDAQPSAKLYLGFGRDTDASELYTKCADGTALELMNSVKAEAGEAYTIMPGLVHCAQGSLRILEIAESSYLDFKLDDMLALGEALDFITYKATDVKTLAKNADNGGRNEKIASLPQFSVSGIKLSDAIRIEGGDTDSLSLYYCLRGEVSVQYKTATGAEEVSVKAGNTVLVPSEVETFLLAPASADTVLLEVLPEKLSSADPYINPDAEEHLPGTGSEDWN